MNKVQLDNHVEDGNKANEPILIIRTMFGEMFRPGASYV